MLVIGSCDIATQPLLNSSISIKQKAQAFVNHLAYGGVLSIGNLGVDRFCHHVWQTDIELLSRSHLVSHHVKQTLKA